MIGLKILFTLILACLYVFYAFNTTSVPPQWDQHFVKINSAAAIVTMMAILFIWVAE